MNGASAFNDNALAKIRRTHAYEQVLFDTLLDWCSEQHVHPGSLEAIAKQEERAQAAFNIQP
jgi:hypothetical protein